jgi:hypothetical protein
MEEMIPRPVMTMRRRFADFGFRLSAAQLWQVGISDFGFSFRIPHSAIRI